MRILRTLLVTALLCTGITLAAAAPASAALATCTSWSTYDTFHSTSYVKHASSRGYQTKNHTCQLKYGDQNDAVKVLQRALQHCHGYDIAIDGVYGSQTKAAVLGVQRRANGAFGADLAEDGVFGPQTLDWIHWAVFKKSSNTMTNTCEYLP